MIVNIETSHVILFKDYLYYDDINDDFGRASSVVQLYLTSATNGNVLTVKNLNDILQLDVKSASAGYHFLFSLNSIPKLLKYSFDLNYILCLIVVYSIFLYLVFINYKFINNNSLLDRVEIFSNKTKLFLLSVNTLVLCFLIYSNYYYREVFLICALPLLLSLNSKYIKIFINFIIIRYFFLFFYTYLNVNEESMFGETIYYIDGVRYFKDIFLISTYVKGFFDLALMSVLCSCILYLDFQIIKNLKHKFDTFFK